MKDERLNEMLSSLPREQASEGFTGRVMASLGERRRSPARRLVLGFALVALVLVATVATILWASEHARKEEIRSEIAELRKEQQALKATLATLRSDVDQKRPVLYIGGDERVDYVLDLHKAMQAPRADMNERTIPVQYTGGTL